MANQPDVIEGRNDVQVALHSLSDFETIHGITW